ncbi:UNVERIFIED_CONTAM: LIM/homeobox protein Lhx2 [Gekko kuhli]
MVSMLSECLSTFNDDNCTVYLFQEKETTRVALSCNENDGDHLDRDQQYPSNQKTKRMRTSFKHHQLRTMKSYFAINHNPDAKDLKQLAQKTGLTKRVLQNQEVEGTV